MCFAEFSVLFRPTIFSNYSEKSNIYAKKQISSGSTL